MFYLILYLGLKVYSLLYRKSVGNHGGEYQYTVMSDEDDRAGQGGKDSRGMDVRLEGIVGKVDPLKGLYTVQMKVGHDRKVEALVIKGACLVKSW